MTHDFDEFFSAMNRDFEAGHLDRVARNFASPTAFYCGGNVVVLNSRNDLIRACSAYRCQLSAAGVAWSDSQITAQSIPFGTKGSVWQTCFHYDENDEEIGLTEVRYFVEITERRILVHLLEYLQFPFPPVFDTLPVFPIRAKSSAYAHN